MMRLTSQVVEVEMHRLPTESEIVRVASTPLTAPQSMRENQTIVLACS